MFTITQIGPLLSPTVLAQFRDKQEAVDYAARTGDKPVLSGHPYVLVVTWEDGSVVYYHSPSNVIGHMNMAKG